MRVIERCAVVSDHSWIRSMTSVFGSLLPCPVRVFTNPELGDAMSWLDSGEIGLEHHLDKGVLSVEISAPLSSQNFEILSHTVDPWLEQGNHLSGIVIHAPKFPGWENLGSLIRHFQFVQNHHKKTRRVAISADGTMASLLPEVGKHFVQAEIKHFGFHELEQAKNWAAQVTAGHSGAPFG